MGYPLATARSLARLSSRNSFDSSVYSDAAIDFAMQRAGDEFLRESGSTRTLATLNLTANTTTLPSMASDWSPDRHLQHTLLCSGTLVNPNIQFVDWNQIQTAMYETGTTNQNVAVSSIANYPTPVMFAFPDASGVGGVIYPPAPTAGFTLQYWYWREFTQWPVGQAVLTPNTNTAGTITSVTVVSGGFYVSTPTLTVSGVTTGSTATLTAVITGNAVTSVTINSGGTGYTSPTILANGSTTANITFNVLDEGMRIILGDGVMAYLQKIEPQNSALAADAMELFLKNVRAYAGRAAGGRGIQIWNADNTSQNNRPCYGGWNGYPTQIV